MSLVLPADVLRRVEIYNGMMRVCKTLRAPADQACSAALYVAAHAGMSHGMNLERFLAFAKEVYEDAQPGKAQA